MGVCVCVCVCACVRVCVCVCVSLLTLPPSHITHTCNRNPAGFSDFGTVHYINSVQYTPDGRSLVKTIGERRFKVVGHDMVDGYHQARVKFVFDERVTEQSEIGEFFSSRGSREFPHTHPASVCRKLQAYEYLYFLNRD